MSAPAGYWCCEFDWANGTFRTTPTCIPRTVAGQEEWWRIESSPSAWAGIRRRIRAYERRRRLARWLFGEDFELVHVGDLRLVNGYVTLWNDVRPIVQAADHLRRVRNFDGPLPFGRLQEPADDVIGALERYEALYPDHVREALR